MLPLHDLIETLTRTARTGVERYYRGYPGVFHYTVHRDARGRGVAQGYSVRYAAICQIGISRWVRHHPEHGPQLPDLLGRVRDRVQGIDDIGDMALWAWAACEAKAPDADRFVRRMKDLWSGQAKGCHAVEVAWVLKACMRAHQADAALRSDVQPVLEGARSRLAGLFEERSGLFTRHRRPGLGQRLSGEIACFADQVYPILALSDAAATLGDVQAGEMAARAADRICDLQGPLGQWWWHYDVPRNRICEEYPVFSVHQHAMAPMALLACDAATGRDHAAAVEKGVRWLWGRNELGLDLVLESEGIIWRDIERREPAKLSRRVKAFCNVFGVRPAGRMVSALFRGFKVNWECRPYELGWILYAWADRADWRG